MIPQAYTARDIGEAYKWIQALPAHVREEMKTMEQMVLSYLRAKAMGTLGNFQPENHAKKTQDFQKTLQTLKAEMEIFDSPPASHGAPMNPSGNNHAQTGTAFSAVGSGHGSPNNGGAFSASTEMVSSRPSPPVNAGYETAAPSLLGALKLDPKSRQIMNEVREGLNLGSDVEVIRMCLVLAHKTLKGLLE